MTAPVLSDALGPRARRRMWVVSVAATGALAALCFVALRRLAEKGQLDADLWRPLVETSTLRFLWQGAANTLKAALIAMVLALVAGALLALGRLARSGPIRWGAGAWVEAFRAVPLLLMIYFAARGLPKYGLDLGPLWFLVLPLVAYNSAVLAEVFRAGILSLERGQSEAAFSLGLSYWQTMLLVVVPQAVRRMVPAIIAQLVTLLKDTSLGYVIPFEELLRRARLSGEYYRNILQTVAFIALWYIVVNFTLGVVARRLEERQRRRYRAGEIRVTGVEDLS